MMIQHNESKLTQTTLLSRIIGLQLIFDAIIFEERFRTVERAFVRVDKFRRLLLRFERINGWHDAFKSLAYTMINLRHSCR